MTNTTPADEAILKTDVLGRVKTPKERREALLDEFEQSGLNLTLYRAYDSDLGRWLSRDPLQEFGGLNLYAYVDNNPINFLDPYGNLGEGWLAEALAIALYILSATHTSQDIPTPSPPTRPAAQPTTQSPTGNATPGPEPGNTPVYYTPPEPPWPTETPPGGAGAAAGAGAAGEAAGFGAAATFGITAFAAVGVFGGLALGNWTPYPCGGTINDNVQNEFVPFWNWWYGY